MLQTTSNVQASFHVSSLTEVTDERALSELFAPFGEIVRVHRKTFQGYGIVEMTGEQQDEVLTKLNGKVVNNRPIKVRVMSDEKPPRVTLGSGDRSRGNRN